MRIVLDTNVFIAIIGKNSRHRWIFDEILSQNFTLCVSQEITLEYVEILERKTTFEVAHNIHQFLTVYPSVEHVEIYYRWNLIPDDPDDNKFIDCAVAAGVQYLVSNDKHFDPIRELNFPILKIIDLATFTTTCKKSS